MIIIFGRRQYGRVDACGSEYAHTTFAHLYYMPLIPISSFWVTDEVGNQRTGYEIPVHGKSVAAAYLRMWAPIIGIAMLAGAPLAIGLPVAVGLFGLSAWSWTWRSIRGEYAVRRSDFNRLAFGMRAEPSILNPWMRGDLEKALRTRWERLGATHSPNDVGRFGAKDPGEAVTAYGLLRLSAIDHGGREEREACERILAGQHDPVAAEDGPYRDAAHAAPADVHQQVASAAATVEARRYGPGRAAAIDAARRKAPPSRARALIVGSLIAGAVAAGGLIETAGSLGEPATGTIADIVASHHAGEYATVFCDEGMPYGDLMEDGHVSHRVFVCAQKDRMMAVLASGDVESLSGSVTGKLAIAGYDQRAWWDEVSSQSNVERFYLDVADPSNERIEAGICMGLAVAAIGLLGFGIRAHRAGKRRTAVA
jgi:hypothetical protein